MVRRVLVGLVGLVVAGVLVALVLPLSPGDPAPARQARSAGDPATAWAAAAYERMGARARVGQLFMVGVDARRLQADEQRVLTGLRIGNVFLRGRSDAGVAATARLDRVLTARATRSGVRPLVAVDQEGGLVQTLTGPGFSRMPSGRGQRTMSTAALQQRATAWATQLRRAGIDLDLAPVADVVPRSVGRRNQPIGRYQRELGHRPGPTADRVAAFVRGFAAAGVATSVKHFPGLGRASGNTDSASGVTAPTRRDDASLAPFRAGIRAGADVVMVSSAHYPRIDPRRKACYSAVVMRTMLRGDLGFRGVIVSDSFATRAMAGQSPATRALRFLSAGGTLVLDTEPRDLHPMVTAVLDRAAHDPAFAAVVRAAVLTVLTVKARHGLVAR